MVKAADAPKSLFAGSGDAAENIPQEWIGFYAGLNTALTQGSFEDEVFDGYYGNGVDGSAFGAQIGYNFAVDTFVLGVKIDGALNQVSGANSNWDVSYSKNSAVLGLGRVGLSKGAYMLYLTGGYSVATVSDRDDNRLTLSGWTVGVGADYVLAKNVVGEID